MNLGATMSLYVPPFTFLYSYRRDQGSLKMFTGYSYFFDIPGVPYASTAEVIHGSLP